MGEIIEFFDSTIGAFGVGFIIGFVFVYLTGGYNER